MFHSRIFDSLDSHSSFDDVSVKDYSFTIHRRYLKKLDPKICKEEPRTCSNIPSEVKE